MLQKLDPGTDLETRLVHQIVYDTLWLGYYGVLHSKPETRFTLEKLFIHFGSFYLLGTKLFLKTTEEEKSYALTMTKL